MIVHGICIEVENNTQIKKRMGGTYPGSRLVYRDQDGNIKEQCLHENAIKYGDGLGESLNKLSPGMAFQMEKKKDGDFWNVVSITIGSGAPPETQSKLGGVMPETRGRNDGVQVQIVRQSSLGHAVATLAAGKKAFTPSDVVEVAKIYENFVHTGEISDKDTQGEDPIESKEDIPY